MSAMLPPVDPSELGSFATEGGADTVLCRVCDTEIDASTGDPVEEVTTDAVAAVQEYMRGSGSAEEGGVQLIGGDDA